MILYARSPNVHMHFLCRNTLAYRLLAEQSLNLTPRGCRWYELLAI